MQIRGINVFQQFKAHFFIKTICLLLFICKTYLSVYRFKIRSMTMKIWSCRRFQFCFTFCTCITLRLAVTNSFLLESCYTWLATKPNLIFFIISPILVKARLNVGDKVRALTHFKVRPVLLCLFAFIDSTWRCEIK